MKCSLGISNFLEESFPFYCFPLFLCINHWGRLSYLSLLFFGTLHSNAYIFPFLLCLSAALPGSWSRSGSDCEEIPHVQDQRRNPSKMVGGAKSHLESNPIPARKAQRPQTNLVPPTPAQDPETPQRLRQNCVWVSPVEVRVSKGLPQGQGLWVLRLF